MGQKVQLPMISDALTLMWCHRNVKLNYNSTQLIIWHSYRVTCHSMAKLDQHTTDRRCSLLLRYSKWYPEHNWWEILSALSKLGMPQVLPLLREDLQLPTNYQIDIAKCDCIILQLKQLTDILWNMTTISLPVTFNGFRPPCVLHLRRFVTKVSNVMQVKQQLSGLLTIW